MMSVRGVKGWFGLSLWIIVADQLSKFAVNHYFVYAEVLPVVPGFFNLTLTYNPGAAFSFLASAGGWQRYLFTALAGVVTAWLSWQMVKGRFSRRMNGAAACIIGGALGNMIDRVVHGYVIDFIQLYYKLWYYPAFNVADSFICIGAVLMVFDSVATQREHREG